MVRSALTLHTLTSALILALSAAACGGGDDGSTPVAPSPTVPYSQVDLRVGTGAEAVAGRRIVVNYTGWLYAAGAPDNKGGQFDSSLSPGRTPYEFVLGAREVITGWDQGVVGMRVGGQRRLVIPPELAYGAAGRGAVPPNAALVFDIELLEAR